MVYVSSVMKIFTPLLVVVTIFSYFLFVLPSGNRNNQMLNTLVINTTNLNSNTLQTRKDIWEREYKENVILPKYFRSFRRVMDLKSFHIAIDILDTFARTMENHSLPYFMYGGTLIGSLRHHGPIMWDDDIDVMVDIEDRSQIYQAFKSLAPEYTLYSTDKMLPWKLFSHKSVKPRANLGWDWPFVDIFFYRRTGNTIIDATWSYETWEFPTNIIFPLIKRPFATLDLYSPKCSLEFTRLKYDINECKSSTWDHKHERRISHQARTIDCTELSRYYPLVSRTYTKLTVVEELRLQGTVLQRTVHEKCN